MNVLWEKYKINIDITEIIILQAVRWQIESIQIHTNTSIEQLV